MTPPSMKAEERALGGERGTAVFISAALDPHLSQYVANYSALSRQSPLVSNERGTSISLRVTHAVSYYLFFTLHS